MITAAFVLIVFAGVLYLALRSRIESNDLKKQIDKLDDSENFY